jgi:UDP-N-acetylmuramoyl-L-alanyl-D-glutamate--2,6-diaminopimelate ligase
MWPLSGRAIAEACGADAPADEIAIAAVNVGEDAVRADEIFVALREDGHDGHAWVEAALRDGAGLALVAEDWPGRLTLAPELRARCLVASDTTSALRRIAGVLRRGFSFPIVAVAGANGKTTTKEMIAALLGATKTHETMNGWTGIPLTLLMRAHARDAPPSALVVEIGIDAIGAMAEHAALVDPDVAVITSLGAEHLAGLRDEATAAREELALFEAAPRARRVYNLGDATIRDALHRLPPRDGDILVVPSGERREGSVLSYEVSQHSLTLSWAGRSATLRVPMPGRHNAENLAVAFAAALALGRAPDALVANLAAFTPPTMRCETRELENGTTLIDDAYNANPSSMLAALDLLEAHRDRPRVAILGDMLDLGEASERLHLALVPRLRGIDVRLVGDAMGVVGKALGELASVSDPIPEGAVVLVKGSRGMHLEQTVAEIEARSKIDLARYHDRFATACVTGTNGKTTTTSLVAAIVAAAGETPCRVTTLGAWVGDERTAVEPSAEAFARTVARAARRGVRTLAIETTSHALADGFSHRWPPRVAVFTNLSRDHLDYHGTPEHYLAAKAQLFVALPRDGTAVLNVADESSALLHEITPDAVTRLGYAARPVDPACSAIPIALAATKIEIDEHGTHAVLAPSPLADALGGRIDLRIVGTVHIENALAAAVAAHALGYSPEAIRAGLSAFTGVPGRFEIVARRPLVVVDYAHTPDALHRTLSVAREIVANEKGRVICVFGCGGERDPGKRSEMGAVAATSADEVIVTNDNPRSEDPHLIAHAIEEGAKRSEGRASLTRILDRGGAIRRALELASPEDIVVICGKGHEKTQQIGDRELPFDDVEVARSHHR